MGPSSIIFLIFLWILCLYLELTPSMVDESYSNINLYLINTGSLHKHFGLQPDGIQSAQFDFLLNEPQDF